MRRRPIEHIVASRRVRMTLNKRLATAVVAAGFAVGAFAAPPPASASGVLPPSQRCPDFLSSWMFHTGQYNEEATNLYLNYIDDRDCGYIAETFRISGNGHPGAEYRNYRVVVVKGFIYPIVHI
jgi:hypothetical protein